MMGPKFQPVGQTSRAQKLQDKMIAYSSLGNIKIKKIDPQ